MRVVATLQARIKAIPVASKTNDPYKPTMCKCFEAARASANARKRAQQPPHDRSQGQAEGLARRLARKARASASSA